MLPTQLTAGSCIAAALLALLSGCRQTSSKGTEPAARMMDVQIGEQSAGKVIELSPGQAVTLTLPENPTTGYSWHLVSKGKPVCSLISDTFKPGERVPGAPGIHQWRFRADRAGTGRIELRLVRTWESKPAARSFSVELRVA